MTKTEDDKWLAEFREPALKRIREYEDYLAQYGILPQMGMEQEFYAQDNAAMNARKSRAQDTHRDEVLDERVARAVSTFNDPMHPGKHSRVFRRLYVEADASSGADPDLHEIVVGKGQNDEPHKRFLPSNIVLATESARKIIADAPKYKQWELERTFLSDSALKKRPHGLQPNISLWSMDGQPLFVDPLSDLNRDPLPVNELTAYCTHSLMKAQHDLMAVYTASPQAFERLRSKSRMLPRQFSVGLDDWDRERGNSLRIQMSNPDGEATKIPDSFYLEDRVGTGNATPELVTLIMLAGVAEGVKSFMHNHDLKNSEEFKEYTKRPYFSMPHFRTAYDIHRNKPIEGLRIPKTPIEALRITRKSEFAKEMMGEEFRDNFCAAYAANKVGRDGKRGGTPGF